MNQLDTNGTFKVSENLLPTLYYTQINMYTTCLTYSVSHNFIDPSKELCSEMALGEVGMSLPIRLEVTEEFF